MTLPKEVQDIIEGVYAFLSVTLKRESLSATTDVIRRKLLAQIKKFAHDGQSIRISHLNDNQEKSNIRITYDCYQHNLNNGLYRLSTSSGSTNYSNGFSGDDVTSSPQTIIEDTSSAEDNEDFYEKFEDKNEFPSLQNSSNGEIGNYKSEIYSNDTKSIEDSYSIVKNVPFRNVIARCDHHGIINKKSKSFLKSSRYLGVIADGLLYLYNKESDDKPKRVIDLFEYKVVCNSSEDNKKKKEYSFQLMAPGKKSHTFMLITSRERDHWVDMLNCAVITRNSWTSKINQHTSVEAGISILNTESNICYKSEEFINDQIDGELYEEVMENELPCSNFEESHESSKITENGGEHKYYEVPLEENDSDFKRFGFPVTENATNKKLMKPERPPLPDILRQKMDQSRPLPPEPVNGILPENYYDPSIYWEIDHDSSFEKDDERSTSFSDTLHSRSLSQEIFDTIKERVPILPDNSNAELSKYCHEKRLGNDTVKYENSSDASVDIIKHCNETVEQYDNEIENNSLYQIPPNSWKVCDCIYQIPPTPIPVLTLKCEDEVVYLNENNKHIVHEFPQLIEAPNNNIKNENSLNSLPYEHEISNQYDDSKDIIDKPLPSVKELIKKFKDQQNKTKENNLPLQTSTMKIFEMKTNVGENCNSYQSNIISPLRNEENRFNIEEDVLTINIETTELKSSSTIDVKTGLFIAKFAYVGRNASQLSFSRGDRILVVDTSKNSWWEGELRGRKGVVHKDYLLRTEFEC